MLFTQFCYGHISTRSTECCGRPIGVGKAGAIVKIDDMFSADFTMKEGEIVAVTGITHGLEVPILNDY